MGLEVEGRAPPRLGGGRFVVVELLGDGGTASVYLAWDGQEKRWCALKALHFKYLKDEDMRRRFAQEAQALSQLRHENITALFFHDDDASPPYLVMELARRGSMMDWVKENGPMPPAMAADVVFQVCQALAEAHAAGIVHRDVKPHNFLLDDSGRCRLTDFGIARLTETTSFTATGSQIGTFSFMAPEQRSDTKSVDLRADIYSVGASLYTLLTARTSAELFVADQDDDLLAAVPPPFRKVIIRSTRYKPDERYASVLELQTDLMNALSRLPPDASGYPPLVRPREPLPPGPPRTLPPGKRFEDLERSLALDTSQPTFVPGAHAQRDATPEAEPRRKHVPYYMPARTSDEGALRAPAPPRPPPPPSPAGRVERQDATPAPLPSYIDRSEIASITKAEAVAAQVRERQEQEASQAAELRRIEAEQAAQGPGLERLVAPIAAAVLVVGLLVVSVVGYGAWSVRTTRAASELEASRFVDVLVAEGNVVYDLGGDRRMFEELYLRAVDERASDHMGSAVAFVSQVDALTTDRDISGASEQSVRRLQAARAAYLDALGGWQGASTSIPGRLAVQVGLATPPD
jgi:serine/threonine protein kinase